MVTEIDLWAVKTRIRDILEADPTLLSYFRKDGFRVGAPPGNVPEAQPMPYLFVTNDEGLIEQDQQTSRVVNNVSLTSKHVLHFMIVFMDKGKDGMSAEKKLDDIGKRIKEVLKENYHLKNPQTDDDPKAFGSYPEETRVLNSAMTGKEVQGRVLMFRAVAYTS